MVGVPAGATGGVGVGAGVGVGVGVGVAGDVIGGGEGEDLRRAAAQGDTTKLLALIEEGAAVNLSDEVSAMAGLVVKTVPDALSGMRLWPGKVPADILGIRVAFKEDTSCPFGIKLESGDSSRYVFSCIGGGDIKLLLNNNLFCSISSLW